MRDRFWSKVNKRGTFALVNGRWSRCWEWQGSKDKKGYGMVTAEGVKYRAHRFAWQQEYGPILDGLVSDHLCRNTSCVRVSHLELVTNRENVMRGIGPTARNAAKTECLRGHPFDEANTRIAPRGFRICKACHLAYVRGYRAKAKAAA